jgi:hypothetical protein
MKLLQRMFLMMGSREVSHHSRLEPPKITAAKVRYDAPGQRKG